MPDLARKLLVKPDSTVRLINAPEGADDLLGALPAGARRSASGSADVVVVFVRNLAELGAAVGSLRRHARSSKAAWVAYPKKSSGRSDGLSRDVIRTTLDATDITPVTQVALDGTWSALRVRPLDEVGH
jgi:hypothetical protein